MTTTLADAFNSQPDWWVTTGRSAVLGAYGAKDCTLTPDVNPGVFFLVLGSGGVDSGHREIRVSSESAFAPLSWSVVDVDNTHKTITFKSAAGVATSPGEITVSVRRVAAP